jgi:uncharacterized protein involved in copper resistance
LDQQLPESRSRNGLGDAAPSAPAAMSPASAAAAATSAATASATPPTAAPAAGAAPTTANNNPGYLLAATGVFPIEQMERRETDVGHFLFTENEALIGQGIVKLGDIGSGYR